MTIKNNNIGDKNRKISGKKIMLVTALLSGGVVIRVNNHINNSFGHVPKEVINFDLTLESTDVLIDDSGTFYVGQGTPIENFDIYDFVTIHDESGNVIADEDVTLEWDVKEYFEGTTFGTKGEYLITITATTADGRTGELEYKLVVKEGHIFEEIETIGEVEVEQTNTKDLIDFQEHFRVLNSATGEETITDINSTLEDEDLRTLGTKQVIFYTELNGTRFTNSVHISVVDTVAPVIELEDSFNNDFEWDQKGRTINISDLDKTLGDFSLDQFATAYDGSGEYELSWDFEEVMTDKMDKIGTYTVTITAIDSSGNESFIEIYVNVSTVKIEFKDGISEVAFELYHDAKIEDAKYKVSSFYNIYDAGGNPVTDKKISWTLTEEMIRELGEHRVTIEVLDDNDELIGSKGVEVLVKDTLAPVAVLMPGVSSTFDIEVNQNMSVDNLFMYLEGISGIDELISVTENSGVWGYRFLYRNDEITDSALQTTGVKPITLQIFDYDIDGNENNSSYLTDENGNEISLTFNIQDTTDPTVNVVNDVIDLEVMQNATKEMIEINNYVEIRDNSGTFTWDLRVKGSQESVMDYEDMLGKITPDLGVAIELVVTDASGNTTYRNMTLIVTDNEAPVIEVRKDEETININPSASELTSIRTIGSYVRVSDNSGKYNLDWDFDTVVNTTAIGVYYVTVTATDDAGNTTEEVITFTVIDNEAPTVIVNTKSIEVEANEYMNVAEFEFDENLNDYITVSDNSGVKPNVTFDYSNVDFSELGVYEVIITATDNANNSAINIIEIKVIAGNPKVNLVEGEIINTIGIDSQNQISGIKAVVKDGKIVVEKANSDSDEDELFTYLTIEDLLEFLTITGEEIVSSTWDMDLINLQLVGTKDVTLNVTNNFGKTTTMVIEVVVINEWDSELKLKDGVENFIDLEIDITNTNRDVAWFKSTYDVKDYVDYRTTGNPDDLEWSINSIDFNKVGSTVITITMNDGTNIHEVSLNLNIIDTTKPVFTIIKDTEAVEINTDDASGFSITDFVTVSDNGDVSPALSWNLSSQVDFGKSGTYTVTIKAVDMYGNESTQEITFDIGDNTKPVITINDGMDTQTIEINSRNESHFNVNSFVTATDNSGVAPELEWDLNSEVDFTTIGTYTVTIKAKDDAGNEAIEVTVEFIIVDTIAPTIDIDASGLDELKIEIDTKSESDYSDWLEDYVTVTDNSGESITPTWNISGVNFDSVGTYEIVITAIDSESNSSTVKVVFVVADTTAPTITLKDNMETTEYEVFNQLGSSLSIDDFATCDDATNCIMSWDMSSVNFDRVGTYVVTIKAIDAYGNESIQEITIEVIDTVAPVIEITRADILVSMGKFKSSDFDVNDFAKVTDNYDNSLVLTWDIDSVDFDSEGVYTVTISAIDSSGNEAAEATVEFEVQDNGMILTEKTPFVVEVDQSNEAIDFDVNTYFEATREDGSTVDNITWNLTDDMVTTYGTHGVTLTIIFDNGTKKVEIEVTLEVIDTTDPTVTLDIQTTTVELGDTNAFDNLNPEDFVIASDNSNDVTYSWDLDNVVEQTVAGTYTVSITVTDVAGNETIVTTEIVVEDNVAPVLELNDDFDRNNMTWSKGTKELSILAGDKIPGEIDLWELVTATDLSTAGLTISWDLADASLNIVEHYSAIISVSDGTNTTTETITVNVLRATPILNDFNVDKSYNEIIVDVDITNINQAISELKIILLDSNGVQITEYDQDLTTPLDALTINHVFNVNSNTEYKVALVYTYATLKDNSDAKTITDTKDVKTLAYAQNDVLGTITDVYLKHDEIIVGYEINNDLGLMTSAELVLLNEAGVEVDTNPITLTDESGSYSFGTLTPNTKYTIELKITYDFNDGLGSKTKTGDSRDISTLAYTEHDVITDITGITQSPSTISADYNITDIYGLIIPGTMKAKIYVADTMTEVPNSEKSLTNLSGTVQFTGLDANTSYVVVIEASLNLQDGSTVKKETGAYTTTEAYSFDEITVNINNIIVDYNDITFDYEVFDPSGLLVGATDADKLKINIEGQEFKLTALSGTVKLSEHLGVSGVNSGSSYDVQIHFDYNLQDGNANISHDTNLYGFVESTRAYDVNTDLTLTSHNLASDMQTIYVDYSLRNLNLIGDMSTLSVTIRNKDTGDYETIAFSALTGISLGQLEGSFELDSINGNSLTEETDYEISISINYDLKDGSGIQTNLLLLEDAQIQTKDVPLVGYNVISTIERGYTFLNVDFHIDDDLSHGLNLLDSFKIALLDENGIPVTNYDYISYPVSAGDNNVKFQNLLSDATYTVVYRIDNPYYGSASGEDEYIDITRKVTTRTYDTNLINIDYTLEQGLTYLYLKDINILNTNEVFEKIDYSSVIVVITYTSREGQVITVERELGSLTEGDMTSAVFSDIQSNRDVNIEFRLEHDLKDGEGIQSGTEEIVRTNDTKTLEYDFTFVIENDEVLVTGLTPGFTGDHLVIFEEVEGYTVKDIKADAFYSDSILFSQLTIPRTLETIGQNAFRNVSLTTVNLTSEFEVIPTVTPRASKNIDATLIISDNAFRDNAIVGFDFTTTETIGVSAFRENELGAVVLTDIVSYVGSEAFINAGVTNLTTGKLLGDDNLGVDTFVGNEINHLIVGNIGFGHNSLGYSKDVFDNTGFGIEFADTVIGEIQRQAWIFEPTNPTRSHVPLTSLKIGDGITVLSQGAFTGNNITHLTLGKNIKEIGNFVFEDNKLTNVTLVEGLEKIGNYAFRNNTSLESIKLPDSLETIGEEAFMNNGIKELVIPDNVDFIDNKAFADNGMTKLTLGALLSDENFGLETFVGNQINNLTIGNVGFKHDSLGYSKDVFQNTGFGLEFAGTATGEIQRQAWIYEPTNITRSHVPITSLKIGDGISILSQGAFTGNLITNLELGKSIKEIGNFAFEDNKLTTVTLVEGLEKIGNYAFRNNTSLQSILLPETLQAVGEEAFMNNGIKELVIPENVDFIDHNAFADNGMTKLTLGALLSDVNFGDNTFVGNSISSLVIGNVGFKHDSLGYSKDVFDNSGFSMEYSDLAVGLIDTQAWIYAPTNPTRSHVPITSLKLGSGITELSQAAFMGNLITDLTLGTGITKIGANAFQENKLTSITFFEGLESIGYNSFKNNYDLENIKLPESLQSIGEEAFYDNNLKSLSLPDAVQEIGKGSFAENDISSLDFGTGLSDISQSAFENNKISILTLVNNISNIGTRAFAGNTIDNLNIPKNIQFVGNEAFADNNSKNGVVGLTSLTIADGVSASVFNAGDTFIGNKIETLIIGSTDFKHNTFGESSDVFNTTTGLDLTFSNNATGTIVDNAWEYTTDSNTSNVQLSGISIGDSITSIGNKSFYGNKLKTVVIGNGVTSLGEQSFASMGITSLTLGNSVETIGKEAFLDNEITGFMVNGVLSSTVPDTVETIGEGAFKDNSITSLTLPDSVSYVDSYAFQNNGMLSLEIGELLSDGNFGTETFIENSINNLIVGNVGFKHNSLGYSKDVFDNSGFAMEFSDQALGDIEDQAWIYDISNPNRSHVQITSLKLGEGIENLGQAAFMGNLITDLTVEINMRKIGPYAFEGNKLVNVSLAEGLEVIDYHAFKNNFNLETIIIPETVTTIGEEAFRDNKLNSITIPSSVLTVGNKAFAGNVLQTVTIDNGVTSNAFGDNVFRANEQDINDTGNVVLLDGTITKLIIGDASFMYNTFGDSINVFSPNGFELIYKDATAGNVSDNAWRYGTGYSESKVLTVGFGTSNVGTNIQTIGNNAFDGNGLTGVAIDDNIKTIGNSAFAGNVITTVSLGNSLTTIGNSAFEGHQLTNLTIPNKVQTIGDNAFEGTTINNLDMGDDVRIIGSSAFQGNNISSVLIKSNIEEINPYAFEGNNLTVVDLSNNSKINNISNEVFANNEITSVILNEYVVSIGIGAFKNNDITTIDFTSNSILTTINSDAFADNAISVLTLGERVTTINSGAFTGNTITTLVLNDDVSTIGDSAFEGNSINGLLLPSSVTLIGALAFKDNNIENLVVPGTVQSIGDNAFENNEMLTLEFGVGFLPTRLGSDTFVSNNINSLTLGNGEFLHNTLGTSSSVFSTNYFDLTYSELTTGIIASRAWIYDPLVVSSSHVPVRNLVIGNNISTVGLGAFEGVQVQSVSIGNSVTEIGSYAFRNNNLNGISLPESLTKVGDQAFKTVGLKEVTIPKLVTSIGESAFEDNVIEKLVFEGEIAPSQIGENSFLTNVINDLTIGNELFRHDTLGESGKVFSDTGFNLTYTDFARGIIPEDSWRYEDSSTEYSTKVIKDLVIGNNITTISRAAFYGGQVDSLILGSKVTTIGDHTFRLSNMSEVILPTTVILIGDRAFASSPNLTKVVFLKNSTSGITIDTDSFDAIAKFYGADGITEII